MRHLPENKAEIDAKDRTTALKLWKYGLNTKLIATRLSRHPQVIRKWVKEAGLRKDGDPPRYERGGPVP